MSHIAETKDPTDEATCAPQPAGNRGVKALLRKVIGNRILSLTLINLLFILATSRLSPHFLSRRNFSVILTNMGVEAMALSIMVMLLVGGMFDLSVDGIVALSGVIVGKLFNAGAGILPSIALALLAGTTVGVVNGLSVNRLRMNPLMATLATWWICLGISFGITKAISPYGFPDAFQRMGQANIFGVHIIVYYAVISLLFFGILLSRTRFGYHVYAMGGGRRAAKLHGINVERQGTILYTLVGLMAAIIGVIMAARLNSGTPNAVDGMTLRVIAAAVIGGCALGGGRGSILGGLLGLLLMNMLSNAATVLGASPYWQKGMIGAVLFVAVAFDAVRGRRTGDIAIGL